MNYERGRANPSPANLSDKLHRLSEAQRRFHSQQERGPQLRTEAAEKVARDLQDAEVARQMVAREDAAEIADLERQVAALKARLGR